MSGFETSQYDVSAIKARIDVIVDAARSSWLPKHDVLFFLENWSAAGYPEATKPADQPPSGSLFIYNKDKVRSFRKDNLPWRRKGDGTTVRETHEKLKFKDVERVNCYYAHSEEPGGIQRRSYWLLNVNKPYVMVHYLAHSSSRLKYANGEEAPAVPKTLRAATVRTGGRPRAVAATRRTLKAEPPSPAATRTSPSVLFKKAHQPESPTLPQETKTRLKRRLSSTLASNIPLPTQLITAPATFSKSIMDGCVSFHAGVVDLADGSPALCAEEVQDWTDSIHAFCRRRRLAVDDCPPFLDTSRPGSPPGCSHASGPGAHGAHTASGSTPFALSNQRQPYSSAFTEWRPALGLSLDGSLAMSELRSDAMQSSQPGMLPGGSSRGFPFASRVAPSTALDALSLPAGSVGDDVLDWLAEFIEEKPPVPQLPLSGLHDAPPGVEPPPVVLPQPVANGGALCERRSAERGFPLQRSCWAHRGNSHSASGGCGHGERSGSGHGESHSSDLRAHGSLSSGTVNVMQQLTIDADCPTSPRDRTSVSPTLPPFADHRQMSCGDAHVYATQLRSGTGAEPPACWPVVTGHRGAAAPVVHAPGASLHQASQARQRRIAASRSVEFRPVTTEPMAGFTHVLEQWGNVPWAMDSRQEQALHDTILSWENEPL